MSDIEGKAAEGSSEGVWATSEFQVILLRQGYSGTSQWSVEAATCSRYNLAVTATQIIEEIKRLDPEQQLGVIRFAYQLDAERQLTGDELSGLAERMVNTTDPEEQARIREQIVRGFYGQRQNA
jgi:hypothetical protein